MKTVTGDLIKLAEQGYFDYIVHGCNCFCVMGGGIAAQLSIKYPQVLQADHCTKAGDSTKLGFWTEAVVRDDLHSFTVINAYTQYRPSTGSDVFEYDKFGEFLSRFSTYIGQEYRFRLEEDSNHVKISIGFPMIGAGLAGGDWSRILAMIEDFAETTIGADVTIVKFG